jgi:trehalose 6-phosphate synthase
LDESIEPYYLVNSRDSIQKIVDKFTNREKLVGLVIYDKEGIKIASSKGLSDIIINEGKIVPVSIKENKITDNFLEDEKGDVYVVVYPLHQGERVAGAFMVVQDADYIGDGVWKIWKENLLKIFAQVFLFFVLILSIIWWAVYRPIGKIVESVRSARVGENFDNEPDFSDNIFFRPLISEIAKMASTLTQARTVASEEARLRLEKLDTPWTAERLKEFIKAYLKDRQIFVVSNREPYIHQKIKGEIKLSVVPSGMNTAVNSVMEACGGTWIAYGSGNADKEMSDENGKLKVPPDDPKYTLKRIWLTEKEVKGYYSFSVEAMYPLCLMTYTRPVFNKEDWLMYRRVNGKFAENILEELKGVENPIILIQDYHFAILARMIKKSRPDAKIALFWHVPWPSAEAFSVCPWRKEILYGMLGADVIGFNTQQFCNNFIDTVGKEIESLIDFERFSISKDSHTAFIRSFPISIAFTS